MGDLDYKTHKILISMFIRAWHPKLIELLVWNTIRYSKNTITCASRDTKIYPGDSGIHMTNPLRAFDKRSRDYPDPEAIAADINAHFIYDSTRPHFKVCVYHDTGQGYHFHLQVHDNTIYRVSLHENPIRNAKRLC